MNGSTPVNATTGAGTTAAADNQDVDKTDSPIIPPDVMEVNKYILI